MDEDLTSKTKKSFSASDFKVKPTILDKFVERVRMTFQIFQNKPQTDIQLAGRFHDIKQTTAHYLKKLKHIKNELRNEIDGELFKFVEAAIEPLIKEAIRIERLLDRQGLVALQSHMFHKYTDWVEKAKSWIQICNKVNDVEAIKKAVTHHVINEFVQLIDRDLQIIEDYLENMMDSLVMESSQKGELLQKLEKKLDPYIQGLNLLRESLTDLNLDQVKTWKVKVDKRREKYFDGALHVIDKVVGDINPLSASEEKHEHLVEILTEIAFLEEEIPKIYVEICNTNLTKRAKESFINSIVFLEQKVHQLNLDLRLTPDLIDRLQELMDTLVQAKEKIDQAK